MVILLLIIWEMLQTIFINDNEEEYDLEKYVVPIESNEEDEFDIIGDNVLNVKVLTKENEEIKDCVIHLEFSRNALLGLGTELIRLAHKFQEGYHTHLYPVEDPNFITQNMGVHLNPNSNELVIVCEQPNIINNLI